MISKTGTIQVCFFDVSAKQIKYANDLHSISYKNCVCEMVCFSYGNIISRVGESCKVTFSAQPCMILMVISTRKREIKCTFFRRDIHIYLDCHTCRTGIPRT